MAFMVMNKVKAYVHIGGDVLVWDADAVVSLDKDWRICAGLIGSLPEKPRQNAQLGLPLKLTPEETTLLLEKGAIELLEYTLPSPTEQDVTTLRQYRQQEFQQQFSSYLEKRERNRLKYTAHKGSSSPREVASVDVDIQPSEPKRAKLEDTDTTIEDYRTHSSFSPLVTIHTADPRPASCYQQYTNWTYPVSERDKLQYSVYKDLWERGYTLTSGLKYGGDYLVYQGHPHSVHSSYIAVVLSWKEGIQSMVSLGRIGSKVYIHLFDYTRHTHNVY